MASGYPFKPPDHDEFRAICIKLHGNAKAIAAKLNITPLTLYSYFKKDPRAKEILDEVRGYNSFTDLDLAEYVNRFNMSKAEENPAVAQRAAEFTLKFKGKERGWIETETKDHSDFDDKIADTLDTAKVRSENALMKELLLKHGISLDQLNVTKTGTEYISGEQTP